MPSIYEHPLYYDVLFGWDRDGEASFYDAALRRHGTPAGGRILEIASGTGQIALRLARSGWLVTGLDLSSEMLAFVAAQVAETGASIAGICADMTSFTLPSPQHAAYNPLSSFRLLPGEEAARSHLTSVANALEPGGIYILDLVFGTGGEAEDDLDSWTMRRGGIEIRATPARIEVRDQERGVELTLDWRERLRPYTPESFEALVASSGVFSLAACYPESGRDADGVSQFALHPTDSLPAEGRVMVALRRDG